LGVIVWPLVTNFQAFNDLTPVGYGINFAAQQNLLWCANQTINFASAQRGPGLLHMKALKTANPLGGFFFF